MPSGKRALLYRVVDGVEHKRCPRCSRFYPATTEFFYARGNGVHSYCRACQIGAVRDSHAARLILAAGMAGAV